MTQYNVYIYLQIYTEAYLKAGYAAEAIQLQERLPEMRLQEDDVLETQKIRALAQAESFFQNSLYSHFV